MFKESQSVSQMRQFYERGVALANQGAEQSGISGWTYVARTPHLHEEYQIIIAGQAYHLVQEVGYACMTLEEDLRPVLG